ncbi:Afadin- and alpha-actinin-binding protein [Bienertia sinuspersici]
MPSSDSDLAISPSSPSSGSAMSEVNFADVNNLEHCIKYLNQTLVTFGFSASLDLFANDPVSVARTCNCMHSLLQQRQRDIEFRESANEQRQRLNSDISRLEAKIERLESQLAAKDREIATITRTEAKATAGFKAQIEKLQQERDEFQKMVIGNQQVRTQQLHEMKRREKEYIKLQEKLNQVLNEKKKESRSGMEIMNLLQVRINTLLVAKFCFVVIPSLAVYSTYCDTSVQKEGRQRGTWNGKKTDNDSIRRLYVDAYEAKNQELLQENNDLRAMLRSMQEDMRGFLNAPNGSSKQPSNANEKLDNDLSQSPFGGKTDVFDLPFQMGRVQIEENLRAKMASIKGRLCQLQDAQKEADVTSEVTERELELEAQLVEARSIIQEQASIMSKHIAKSEKRRESLAATPEVNYLQLINLDLNYCTHT